MELQGFPGLEKRVCAQTGLASFRDFVPVRFHGFVQPETVCKSWQVEADTRVAHDELDTAHSESL